MVAKIVIDKMFKKIDKMFSKIQSPKTMRLLGEDTVETIVNRTRGEGKGVKNQFGNPSKLKQVTPKYAKWRHKQERHPDAAKGRKSNLTFKGTLLDNFKVIKATKKEFRLGWSIKKERDKAGYQDEAGRTFIKLSKKETNSLIKKYDVIVKKASKNI